MGVEMAFSIIRAARAAGLTLTEHRAAVAVLGPAHPLTKAVGNLHTLAPQSVVSIAAVAVGIVGVLAHVPHATLELCIAAPVCVGFGLAWWVAHGFVRDRARDLIATGRD